MEEAINKDTKVEEVGPVNTVKDNPEQKENDVAKVEENKDSAPKEGESAKVVENQPAKTGENEAVQRDEKGRFIPGVSGNPEGGGRPKGSVSITRKIKEELSKIPEGQRTTYLEALVKKIFKKAIVDEDHQMIKTLWSYIDGMPKQSIEMEMDANVNEEVVMREISTHLFTDRKVVQRVRELEAQKEVIDKELEQLYGPPMDTFTVPVLGKEKWKKGKKL